ncbi:MAG: hypothetical protein ACD_46C00220G0006 [uncultured bacterium]|nr:MAG: hypothetical protein ACD_46C00220G0006 [uncultured bacterium]
MSAERKLILEMLKEDKINIDEAEKLLEGVDETQDESSLPKSVNKKFLKILVIEDNNTKVNVNIPIALAEVGLKLIPKDQLKIEGKDINIEEILKLIQEGNEGELVNIETTDKEKEVKVKIFIE